MKIKFLSGITFQDTIFLLILIGNLFFVSYLGTDIYYESVKLEIAKENGEEILAWVNNSKKNTDTNKPSEPQFCLPKGSSTIEHTWKQCEESIFGDDGKFHALRNAIKEDNPVVAKSCIKGDENTKGAFIFEKSSIGSNGLSVIAPIDDGEILTKENAYRMSVCDRGNYRIFIGEIEL